MRKLFLDKYRVDSARKKGHNYSSPGKYFVTINTDAQINWFGSIKRGKIKLSNVGKIVRDEWLKSEMVRDNVQLDEYITMPNHIHGIIIILPTPVETARWAVSSIKSKFADTSCKSNFAVSPIKIVSSEKIASPIKIVFSEKIVINNPCNRSQLISSSLGSIIGQFKSICTKRIRNRGHKYFKWQDRFYDHIIREKHELEKVREYITSNPIRRSYL